MKVNIKGGKTKISRNQKLPIVSDLSTLRNSCQPTPDKATDFTNQITFTPSPSSKLPKPLNLAISQPQPTIDTQSPPQQSLLDQIKARCDICLKSLKKALSTEIQQQLLSQVELCIKDLVQMSDSRVAQLSALVHSLTVQNTFLQSEAENASLLKQTPQENHCAQLKEFGELIRFKFASIATRLWDPSDEFVMEFPSISSCSTVFEDSQTHKVVTQCVSDIETLASVYEMRVEKTKDCLKLLERQLKPLQTEVAALKKQNQQLKQLARHSYWLLLQVEVPKPFKEKWEWVAMNQI